MFIQVGCEIAFNFPVAVPMVLMLRLHPSREATTRKPEKICVSADLPMREFTDSYRHCRCHPIAVLGFEACRSQSSSGVDRAAVLWLCSLDLRIIDSQGASQIGEMLLLLGDNLAQHFA